MDGAKWYRRLIKLYPARFREEYETPLENDFRDEYRESRGGARFWMRTIADFLKSAPVEFSRETAQDLRFSVRVYRKRPVVTMLVIAALAMAIGATTGVFSVVNALLFRSLPFREPEQLVALYDFPVLKLRNVAEFHAWASSRPYLEDAAIHTTREMNVNRAADATRVMVSETSFNYLSVLGVETEIGRTFMEGEDVPGHELVYRDRSLILAAVFRRRFASAGNFDRDQRDSSDHRRRSARWRGIRPDTPQSGRRAHSTSRGSESSLAAFFTARPDG